MPTYGYRCPKCSLEFDVWQRMTDEPVATCPNCGAVARRLFFPAGIVFKGSGFYKTDSRAKSTSSDGKAASSSKPTSTKPESTSTSSDGGGKNATTSSPATPD